MFFWDTSQSKLTTSMFVFAIVLMFINSILSMHYIKGNTNNASTTRNIKSMIFMWIIFIIYVIYYIYDVNCSVLGQCNALSWFKLALIVIFVFTCVFIMVKTVEAIHALKNKVVQETIVKKKV